MDPLISTSQLASRLQRDLDASTADLAVAGASGMIRSIARQTISFVSQETIELPGGGTILKLPQRPVIVDDTNPLTVVEAAWFGSIETPMVEGRDYERLGEELTRAYPYWLNTRLQGWPYNRPIGVWAPKVRVTYSHGETTIPDHIQKIGLDIAGQLYDNPTLLRSQSIDDFTEQFAVEALGAATVEGIREQLRITGTRRGAHTIYTS